MSFNTHHFNEEQYTDPTVYDHSQNLDVPLDTVEERFGEYPYNVADNNNNKALVQQKNTVNSSNNIPVIAAEWVEQPETVQVTNQQWHPTGTWMETFPEQSIVPFPYAEQVEDQENQQPSSDYLNQFNAENFFIDSQSEMMPTTNRSMTILEQRQYPNNEEQQHYPIDCPSTNQFNDQDFSVDSHGQMMVSYQQQQYSNGQCSLVDASTTTQDIFLPGKLDTAQLVEEVSVVLKKLKICQNDFGEKILQRSQGTVSDIMTKPKPWKHLRNGQDVYLKMYVFLQLSDEMKLHLMSMDSESVHAWLGLVYKKKEKKKGATSNKQRTIFDQRQKEILNEHFADSPHPSKAKMVEIAEEIDVPTSSVKNYFQNRRNRKRLMEAKCPEAKRQRMN